MRLWLFSLRSNLATPQAETKFVNAEGNRNQARRCQANVPNHELFGGGGLGLAAWCCDAFAPPGSRCGGNESSTVAATRRQRPLQLLHHLAESSAAAVSLVLAAITALLTLLEVPPIGSTSPLLRSGGVLELSCYTRRRAQRPDF